jgi:hypothetical protein
MGKPWSNRSPRLQPQGSDPWRLLTCFVLRVAVLRYGAVDLSLLALRHVIIIGEQIGWMGQPGNDCLVLENPKDRALGGC